MRQILITLAAGFFALTLTSSIYAFDVELLLSNHTNIPVSTKGSVNYETTDGGNYWGQPLNPQQSVVPAKAVNVPQDQVRTDLTHYDLEYFDIYNQEGKLITTCMDNYLGLSQATIIKFDLFVYGQDKKKYECHRTLQRA